MQKVSTLCLWLLFVLPSVRAQNIDSLYRVVENMPLDTHRVMAYRELFRALYFADRKDELLAIADKGLTLSRSLNYGGGIDRFILYKASSLDILGRGAESIALFEEGLALAKRAGQPLDVADYHTNIGAAHYGLGNLDKAQENYLSAYTIYKQLGKQEELSKNLNNIGIIYRSQGKHDRAEEIYKESLSLKLALKDTAGLAATYLNLATLYSKLKRMEDAFVNQQKALDFYQKLNYQDDVAGCHSLLGEIYYDGEHYKLAKIELQKAVAYYESHKMSEYSVMTYTTLGNIAYQENSFIPANQYFNKALEVARALGQKEKILEILRGISRTESQLGNYPAAFNALQEAFALRDTITEEKRLALMEEMQTKFEVAQKDNEIKISQIDLQQRTRERNWLIGGAVLLLLLSMLIFFGLRSRIRANKKIATQESALQKQQILQLEQEAKLTALSAMIEGQEKERSRIANDLHDSLGGLLSSVKSHFNALEQPDTKQEIYLKTNTLIDDACGEVRRIAHNMMPRALALSGLQGALEDLAQDLLRQGLVCKLELIGMETPLDNTQAVTIFRIIQEITNNVLKHAQAHHLLLQLIRHENTLSILAEDDGKGFDVPQARSKKGLGLSSIESRVKFLQGSIEWDSVPGEGSQVSISLPV